MFPTKKRSHPSIFVRDNNLNFLFDCGENTQRQMRIAEISPTKLDYIFITHWHGDHTLGLAGLIQSLSASQRERELKIFGPKGTKKRLKSLLNAFSFDLNYNLKIKEFNLKKGKTKKILENEKYFFEAIGVKHNIPCLNYSYVKKGIRKINLEYTKKYGLKEHPLLGKLQKGKTVTYKGKKIKPEKATYKTPDKKITYITDTSYLKELEKFSKNSDLIISEATFSDDMKNKANEYNHLTFSDAAKITKKSKSKKLILTHFSQRYKNLKKHKKEAIKIFPMIQIAKDFKKIKI